MVGVNTFLIFLSGFSPFLPLGFCFAIERIPFSILWVTNVIFSFFTLIVSPFLNYINGIVHSKSRSLVCVCGGDHTHSWVGALLPRYTSARLKSFLMDAGTCPVSQCFLFEGDSWLVLIGPQVHVLCWADLDKG